jgi:eukaryotic-like serine/threonine-protein kinase
MSESRICPNCGATRPAQSPEGLCPRCLLQQGLGSDPSGQGRGSNDHTIDLPAKAISVLDSIGATIGGVPRVLLRDTDVGETPSPIIRPTNGNETSTRYRIDGEIARGGMGSILKGRDPDLGRDVAIKVLREDLRENDELVRRFVEEAQIGGQLQHPGVVPIYELGAFADRRPFFSMKLVKGQTLADLLKARPSPSDDLPRFLSIFAAMAQTMAYSHTRGVIHRDLKPSNVMVGSFGEVQVMDWGLAKVLARGGIVDDAKAGKEKPPETLIATARSGSDLELSHAGSILGTPSYMAPEQARGEIDRVNQRADVFALGSILGEILTGSPAFTGRTSMEVVRKASRGDTGEALARLEACGAEADLIALTRDCLQAEPEDRPHDAYVVADRITAYVAGVQERVQAAERERAVAVAKAIEERRRRKVQLALAASVLALTTLGGLSTAYYLQQRAEQAATDGRVAGRAETLVGQARENPEDLARWQLALASVEQSEAARGEAAQPRLMALRSEIEAGLKAARRDKTLLDRLVDVRSGEDHDPDGSATDADYADAFREAEIDFDKLPPAEAGARIKARPPSVALALAESLDDWAAIRRNWRSNTVGAARLGEAARVADPDPWRIGLRTTLDQPDKAIRLVKLRDLAAKAKLEEMRPTSLYLLGNDLNNAGDSPLAESVLRAAQRSHPRDLWVNYALGQVLEQRLRRDEAIRFYTAARSIRPETAHALAHALENRGDSDEAIAVFRDLKSLRPGNAHHLGCLGRALKAKGQSREASELLEAAVAVGREAIRIKPDFAGAYYALGNNLNSQGKLDEAVAEFREAIRLQPDFAVAYYGLGSALRDLGKSDEAVAEFREAIRLKPNFAEAHTSLGNALYAQRKLDEAIALHREAIRLKPDLAVAHSNVGLVLKDQGKLDEAIEEWREAIRLKSDDAEPRFKIGRVLYAQGKLDEAIAEFREAIRLQPDFVEAHTNLGVALKAQGKLDQAVAAYREAIRLKPNDALAQNNLGNALQAQGKLDDAVVEFREAIRLKPNLAEAYYGLGNALKDQGKLDDAVVEFREAIRVKPDFATAYCYLGQILRSQGDYVGSLAMFRMGHELGSKQPDWRYPSAQWVASAEQFASLAARLPALLKGEERPNDVSERLVLVQMCYDTKRFASAARLWTEALEVDPKLGDDRQIQHRYNAACAASMAAAGQGKDDPPPDDAAKAKLRGQALDWLKAELETWMRLLESSRPQARPFIVQTLQHWKADADLAGIRDPERLAKLPESERQRLRAFWAEVDALLAKANGGTAKP